MIPCREVRLDLRALERRLRPANLPRRLWLDFYAQRFGTVENSFTFYRLPERSLFEQWRRRAPGGFRFVVKGITFTTHVNLYATPPSRSRAWLNASKPSATEPAR